MFPAGKVPRSVAPPTAGDERGNALSVLVVLLVPVLIVMVGLVVDGGGRLAAERRAESVAAAAARSGADAHAMGGAPAAQSAAEQYLRAVGVDGEVTVADHVVTVHTSVPYQTVLVSVIGIDELTGRGSAEAHPEELRP